MKFQKKIFKRKYFSSSSLSPLGEIYIDHCLQKERGPLTGPKVDDISSLVEQALADEVE